MPGGALLNCLHLPPGAGLGVFTNDAAVKVVGGKIPDFAKPYPAVIGYKLELY